MNSTRNLMGLASLTVLTAGSASAAVFWNPSGNWSDGGSVVAIGTPFSVGDAAVTIRSLGIFDMDEDGLEYAEQVGIFTTDKTLLGSVEIKAGTASPLRDGTRWEDLTLAINLNPNTEYVLAWTVRQNGVPINVAQPGYVFVDPLFNLAGTGFTYTETGVEGLNFPNQGQRSVGLYAFGGNMELVPEPMTTGLVAGAGLLGFAVWRQRRNRNRRG